MLSLFHKSIARLSLYQCVKRYSLLFLVLFRQVLSLPVPLFFYSLPVSHIRLHDWLHVFWQGLLDTLWLLYFFTFKCTYSMLCFWIYPITHSWRPYKYVPFPSKTGKKRKNLKAANQRVSTRDIHMLCINDNSVFIRLYMTSGASLSTTWCTQLFPFLVWACLTR